MEILGKKYRTVIAIFYQGWAAIGFMMVAVMAHFLRDHFHIQLYLGLSPLVFLTYYW